MLSVLDGYKTYIGLVAGGVLGIAVTAGWVAWEQVDWIAVLISTWTGVAVAHKGNKIVGR